MRVVSMKGNTVTLINPAELSRSKSRDFTFDHAYWSHDGFRLREDGYAEATSDNYADQVHNAYQRLSSVCIFWTRPNISDRISCAQQKYSGSRESRIGLF